jgi:hypothetical protein
VGFFGTYLYDEGQWHDVEPGTQPHGDGPWLLADIYDSDITTLTYHPPGPGSGIAYLGVTPRTYFENTDASRPTDVAREAAGLATWWATIQDDAPATNRVSTMREHIAGYLAPDADPDEDTPDDEDPGGIDTLDDGEIFVEVKTARLLHTLELPLPAALDDMDR